MIAFSTRETNVSIVSILRVNVTRPRRDTALSSSTAVARKRGRSTTWAARFEGKEVVDSAEGRPRFFLTGSSLLLSPPFSLSSVASVAGSGTVKRKRLGHGKYYTYTS